MLEKIHTRTSVYCYTCFENTHENRNIKTSFILTVKSEPFRPLCTRERIREWKERERKGGRENGMEGGTESGGGKCKVRDRDIEER